MFYFVLFRKEMILIISLRGKYQTSHSHFNLMVRKKNYTASSMT